MGIHPFNLGDFATNLDRLGSVKFGGNGVVRERRKRRSYKNRSEQSEFVHKPPRANILQAPGDCSQALYFRASTS